jgi:hypothetical protein
MQSKNDIITTKYLRVCPPTEAVNWLKERRQKIENVNNSFLLPNRELIEGTLLERFDAYIDFGLALYGVDHKTAQKLYSKGDLGLRCTILANTPNGGYDAIQSRFVVAELAPDNLVELSALMSNPNIDDRILEFCFERKQLFEKVSDEHYRNILLVVGDNPRLSKPYDDRWVDGYADYSYHKVFNDAWNLTKTVPATVEWAAVLAHLLRNCLPPSNFDPIPAISRWYIDAAQNAEERNWHGYGFYVRSRLADLLNADDALRNADDLALRTSFYRRFDPRRYPNWKTLAPKDGEEFLTAALENKLIWKSPTDRETLSALCWEYPDPRSNMDMPNFFRAREDGMRRDHPEWFEDLEGRAPNASAIRI